MSFEIEYDKQPQKFLKKQEKHISKRIIDKIIEIFLETPIPKNSTAIIGEHGIFRVRVGSYRALYRVNYKIQKIVIVKIDKRERIY